jgi:hypothetical protein
MSNPNGNTVSSPDGAPTGVPSKRLFALPALQALFSRLASWLIMLKYAGLALAAASSIWVTVNVLTTTTANGQKELTPAGFVAIGLTILGLVTSIISDDLQRRRTAQISRQQVSAEAKRTNSIIIAGQPLTSGLSQGFRYCGRGGWGQSISTGSAEHWRSMR